MVRALRDAVLGADAQMCINGCQAALWLQEYDLIPPLLNALGDQVDANSDVIAGTLLALADQLYADLASSAQGHRDPELARHHVIGSLEASVQRFARHRRREVVEAFLLLAKRDNATLMQILQDPHHGSYRIVLDLLLKSPRAAILRLLLSFLDDPHAPAAALGVVGNRSDPAFIGCLLRKIGREPSAMVRQNLKRLASIAWLRDLRAALDELDAAQQHAAVRLVMASGVPRPQAFAVIEHLIQHGTAAGRRAAAEALNEFNGAEANALAMKALDDPDPAVQAAVAVQVRRRGIPGIVTRLVDLLESPHFGVRQAARSSLAEFTFKRFLAAFDMLDDEVRRSTGLLVKRVDPQTIPLLREEMHAPSRSRRLRAVAIARAVDGVAALEPELVELLHDEDHFVRGRGRHVFGRGRFRSQP